MQAPPQPSQAPELTSYWLSQHSAAFLMHLKDISARIDPADPKHAQLRSLVKTYLQEAEELEKSLAVGEAGRPEEDREEVALLEKQVEELNAEVDDLTAKLIQGKLTNISAKQKRLELEKVFLKFIKSIYNPLIASLNRAIGPDSAHKQLVRGTLPLYESEEPESLTEANQLMENNCKRIESMIELSKARKEKLSKDKARLSEQITGIFERYDGDLFPLANRRYETTSRTLENIAQGERKVEELDSKIGELEERQNRKLASIASYRQGIEMMSKSGQSNEDNFSTEGSSDLEFQKTHSQLLETSPQVVFHQEKPKPYVRVLLAAWLAVLAASTLALAIA